MKTDALTLGAVGFAAFAAWYVLRPKTTQAGPLSGTDAAYAMATSQRQQVGANTYQNTDYLKSWSIYSLWDKDASFGSNGFYGLKA